MGEGLGGLFPQPEENAVVGGGMAGCEAGEFLSETVHGEMAGEFDAGAVEIEDQLAQEKGFCFHVVGIGKGKVL